MHLLTLESTYFATCDCSSLTSCGVLLVSIIYYFKSSIGNRYRRFTAGASSVRTQSSLTIWGFGRAHDAFFSYAIIFLFSLFLFSNFLYFHMGLIFCSAESNRWSLILSDVDYPRQGEVGDNLQWRRSQGSCWSLLKVGNTEACSQRRSDAFCDCQQPIQGDWRGRKLKKSRRGATDACRTASMFPLIRLIYSLITICFI